MLVKIKKDVFINTDSIVSVVKGATKYHRAEGSYYVSISLINESITVDFKSSDEADKFILSFQ